MRLVAMALLIGGCRAGAARGRPEAPAPLVPTKVPSSSPHGPPHYLPDLSTLSTCAIRAGRLVAVRIDYHSTRGDSIVDGRPFREVFPVSAEYAEGTEWYRRRDSILVNGVRYSPVDGEYVSWGPRLPVAAGTYRGVMLFRPPAPEGDRVYLPLRPGCVFQGYAPVAAVSPGTR